MKTAVKVILVLIAFPIAVLILIARAAYDISVMIDDELDKE